MPFTGAAGGEPGVGVLCRRARQQQHGCKMHDAAEHEAPEQPQKPADHAQAPAVTAGMGASFAVRVATPTGVS